jgi:DNA-binding CsgD family transcriptional regulator
MSGGQQAGATACRIIVSDQSKSDPRLADRAERAVADLADARAVGRPSANGRNGSSSPLTAFPGRVLIFDVDAAGISEENAPARRLRLRSCAQDGVLAHRKDSANGEVSAVLVLRALTPRRLLSCLRAVTRDGAAMPPELLCQMLPVRPGEWVDCTDGHLTPRELAVLRMLADGEVTRTIAERLNYSERTVKNIVRGVLVKLNCRTRAHAVATATRVGVI